MDSENDLNAVNDSVQRTLAEARFDYYELLARAYLARYPKVRELYEQ